MSGRSTTLGKSDLSARTNHGDAVSTSRQMCQRRSQADFQDSVQTGTMLSRRSLSPSARGYDEKHYAGPSFVPPIHSLLRSAWIRSWQVFGLTPAYCTPARTLAPVEHIPASHDSQVLQSRRKNWDECQRDQLGTNHDASRQRITMITRTQCRSMAYVQREYLRQTACGTIEVMAVDITTSQDSRHRSVGIRVLSPSRT